MNLADLILGSNSGNTALAQHSVAELKQLTQKHPYFTAGLLLLAARLKENSDENFSAEMQKLSLYVDNPFWLTKLLNKSDGENMALEAELEEPATIEEVVVQAEHKFRLDTTEAEDSGEAFEDDSIPVDTTGPDFQMKLPGFKEEIKADAGNATLSFEPYHTVDYFASQGIKFKDDGKPKDRFTEQLRSFTEWLKTMKRVPAAEVAATVPGTDEKKVEQMAEQSIADRLVVTEAMAEVWEKQGDRQKAVEIYEKLSLLDPAKSSYFAAKIEHLKNL